jgi:hypothetical protein
MGRSCLHSLTNQNFYSLGGIPMGRSCLHSLTNQKSYSLGGIPMGRSCLHSLSNQNSCGEIVSPFLIQSKSLWGDCVSIPYSIKMLMWRSCLDLKISSQLFLTIICLKTHLSQRGVSTWSSCWFYSLFYLYVSR